VDLRLVADETVVAKVDPRYQSYNIEMVEVTGGTFWQPYDSGNGRVVRPPIDLTSTKLRNLARALGPAYIRISGSWANDTYFDPDATAGAPAPKGFRGTLTGAQWAAAGRFADAVDGRIVTSFASNSEVRDANGAWKPDQARALLRFSKAHGVPVVAAELFNEPNLGVGMPAGYDADDFARDLRTFRQLLTDEAPEVKLVGPGTTAEFTPSIIKPTISSTDILDRTGPIFEAFSYHSYPKVSERCGSTAGPDLALDEGFLTTVQQDAAHYATLHDRYEPDAPLWTTETAEAACGGDRWAATYADVIRYVNTLGQLANGNGNVVFHNTLAASDYGLVDEDDFTPRPDYWAAVLWSRLMGPTVLRARPSSSIDDLWVYAHCTPTAKAGHVTYAVVNSSASATRTVATRSADATVYQLTGEQFDGASISLNGSTLTAHADGTLPELAGRNVAGAITIPPASVSFVVDRAANAACR